VIYILVVYIPSLLNFIHWILFDTALNILSVTTVLNSDVIESINFIKERINGKIISVLLVYTIVAMWLLSIKCKQIFLQAKKYRLIIAGMLLMQLLIGYSSTKVILSAASLQLEELTEIYSNSGRQPLNNIVSRIPEQKQTYVVVIGESVDRKHMSIYGYERKTTPNFDHSKNELYVFKNVRSAFSTTTQSVKSALQIKSENCKNILTFFKDAGFKIFWFSNQGGSFSFFNNQVEKIAKLSHVCKFIYNNDDYFSDTFDEALLDYLDEALNDRTVDKKIIFLHLIGSHVPLDIRYPGKFNVFKLPNSYNYKWKAMSVCCFDNSILYTDHVLMHAIKMLKKRNDCSWLLYFSDHGQDIYDTAESKIFREISGKSNHLYEIPLIVWVSEKYKLLNKDFIAGWDLEKKYVIDKLSYSIAHLARLDHAILVEENSIFYNQKSLLKRKR
jgi:heptose-I-phosphate ethanolaminephosphotransferase